MKFETVYAYFRNSPLKFVPFFLVLLAAPLLFIGDPVVYAADYIRSFWNLGHIPLFFMITLIVFQVFHPQKMLHIGLLLVAVLAASIGLEWCQSLIGRDPSWSDVGYNIAGAIVAISWSIKAGKYSWLARILSSLLLVYCLIPALKLTFQHFYLNQRLPILANFEDSQALRRWSRSVEKSPEIRSEGNFSGKITLADEWRQRRANLRRLAIDWRPYDELVFDIYNPANTEISFNIRIEDAVSRTHSRRGDNFDKTLNIPGGWHTIEIDLDEIAHGPSTNRVMDLGNMRYIRFYKTATTTSATFYIDNMRLK